MKDSEQISSENEDLNENGSHQKAKDSLNARELKGSARSWRTSGDDLEPYVDVASGWRAMFFAMVISVILGLSVRLYFSPSRVSEWVEEALQKIAVSSGKLDFDSAELRLADGIFPKLSLVMNGVRFSPHPECVPEASLKIMEADVPLRIGDLLGGRVAAGLIRFHHVQLDLDQFKKTCSANGPESNSSIGENARSEMGIAGEVDQQSQDRTNQLAEEESASILDHLDREGWWKNHDVEKWASVLGGIEVLDSEVLFENQKKSVLVSRLMAKLDTSSGKESIHLKSQIRLPTTLTYGEKVAPLDIQGVILANTAEVRVKAGLAEGDLEGKAKLSPAESGGLNIEANMTVGDLPLSSMVPILFKAGLVREDFHPKFLWLDCQANIRGKFQGLFKNHPLHLENCVVEGSGGRVSFDRALRHANGIWDPFLVKLEKIDLKKLLDTFGVEGPDGILNQFGELSGDLQVTEEGHLKLVGDVKELEVRFSNQNVLAHQFIGSAHAELELGKNSSNQDLELVGRVNNIDLVSGRFDGDVEYRFVHGLRNGEVKVRAKELILDQKVQSLLVGEQVGKIGGEVELGLNEGHLKKMKGNVKIEEMRGANLGFDSVDMSLLMNDQREVNVKITTPSLYVKKASALYSSVQPLFFGLPVETVRVGADEMMTIQNFGASVVVSSEKGAEWKMSSGSLENGKIRIKSAGHLDRSRQLEGWVSLDYPAYKKLKWIFSGPVDGLRFQDDPASQSLAMLRKKPSIDSSVLGLLEAKKPRSRRNKKSRK